MPAREFEFETDVCDKVTKGDTTAPHQHVVHHSPILTGDKGSFYVCRV